MRGRDAAEGGSGREAAGVTNPGISLCGVYSRPSFTPHASPRWGRHTNRPAQNRVAGGLVRRQRCVDPNMCYKHTKYRVPLKVHTW